MMIYKICFSNSCKRSKRFQSSYCAKVKSGSKKKVEGGGGFFFCSCPSFLDEPREETLATQATRKLVFVTLDLNGQTNVGSQVR